MAVAAAIWCLNVARTRPADDLRIVGAEIPRRYALRELAWLLIVASTGSAAARGNTAQAQVPLTIATSMYRELIGACRGGFGEGLKLMVRGVLDVVWATGHCDLAEKPSRPHRRQRSL